MVGSFPAYASAPLGLALGHLSPSAGRWHAGAQARPGQRPVLVLTGWQPLIGCVPMTLAALWLGDGHWFVPTGRPWSSWPGSSWCRCRSATPAGSAWWACCRPTMAGCPRCWCRWWRWCRAHRAPSPWAPAVAPWPAAPRAACWRWAAARLSPPSGHLAPGRTGRAARQRPASIDPMQFIVLGAGAIGSYVGGRLAAGGRQVTLVAPPPRRAALADRAHQCDPMATARTCRRPACSPSPARWPRCA